MSVQTRSKVSHSTHLVPVDMTLFANSNILRTRKEVLSKYRPDRISDVNFIKCLTLNTVLICLMSRFGTYGARGGVDLLLTRNDDFTLEKMLEARKGSIGPPCDKETIRQKKEEYLGPYDEPVRTFVSSHLVFEFKHLADLLPHLLIYSLIFFLAKGQIF